MKHMIINVLCWVADTLEHRIGVSNRLLAPIDALIERIR